MQRNLKRFARFPSFRGWDTHPEETHPTSGHQQVGASPNRSRPYLLKMAYVATARKARRGCPRCVPAQREGPKLVLFCEMQQSNQKELLSVSKLTWSLENYVKVPPSGRRRRPPRRSVFAFVCDFFGGGVARAVAVGGCVRAAGRVAGAARAVLAPRWRGYSWFLVRPADGCADCTLYVYMLLARAILGCWLGGGAVGGSWRFRSAGFGV